MTKIYMLSLGCPRNLLDSEVMLGFLKKKGYQLLDTADKADIAIVNTCSFIKDAKAESIDMILDLAELKKAGKLKGLVVTGCLPQRFKDNLKKELPEVDAFLGVGNFYKIPGIIDELLSGRDFFEVTEPDFLYDHTSPRHLITPPHYAYVKIAEGCDNRCKYCIIYKIRGKYRSRPIDSILEETKSLASKYPISEINLIAQDTTYYGTDIYKKPSLTELLKVLTDEKNTKYYKKIQWIRLLYTHPAHIQQELIDLIKEQPLICNYIDLPIQHINDGVLKAMGRGTTKKDILDLINRLRDSIPGLAIRSSLIVGHPGEGAKEFKELLEFMKQIKFERLGIFTYSKEEGTPAYDYPEQVPEKEKKRRFDVAMKLQQEISADSLQAFLGRKIQVLIDEQNEDDKSVYVGRTYADAPEVDGQVFVHADTQLKPGDFVNAEITDTLEYDLVGDLIK